MRHPAAVALKLVVGSVLVLAAVLKLWPVLIGAKDLAPEWLEISVAALEVGLALLLIGNWKPRLGMALAIACFAVFFGVAGYRWWNGAKSCGCFGVVSVHPWLTATFDLSCLLALGIVWRMPKSPGDRGDETKKLDDPAPLRAGSSRGTESKPWTHWGMVALVSTLAVAIGVDGGLRWRAQQAEVLADQIVMPPAGGSEPVILEPSVWIEKRFPLARYLSQGQTVEHGHWLVVLYQADCRHCRRMVPQILEQGAALTAGGRKVLLAELPPYADAGDELVPGTMPAGFLMDKLSNVHIWSVTTPALIDVDDGKVRQVFEGVEDVPEELMRAETSQTHP
jgi:hypothetical protein